jgi:signal transduction histidine kinase
VLEDRERIARDLHDVVIQRLFAAGLGLQSISGAIVRDEVRERVRRTVDDLDMTIRDIRTAIFELRAPAGSLRGELMATVAAVAESLGFRPALHVTGPIDHAIPDVLGVEMLAVVREALSNVVRHALATAVTVAVSVTGERLAVTITDDGAGTDPAGRPEGQGLVNMRRRAEDRGGTFTLGPADGHGTVVSWSVPITD